MWDCEHLDHVMFIFAWRASAGMGANRGWVWPPATEGVELVLKGRSRLELPGGAVEVGPGAMVWHQAGERTLHEIDPRDPYQVVNIKFRISRPPRDRPPRLSVWSDPEECRAFADEALRVYHRGGFDQREFCRYLYTRLRWQVHRAHIEGAAGGGSGGGGSHAVLGAALDLIDHHYARKLSIAQLAAAVGLSATHLHRLFRVHLGATPLEVLIRRRLTAACVLLAHEPQRSVRSTAAACGFPDPVHFGRMFKLRHGCTPLTYRRRHAHEPLVR